VNKRDDLPPRVQLARSVRARLGLERGFLFEERTGRVYSLTATAAFSVARLQEGTAVNDIVAGLTRSFEVDQATARREIAVFVNQLLAEGLATAADGGVDG
jgi:hypothetical protein